LIIGGYKVVKKFLVLSLLAALMAPNTHSILYGGVADKPVGDKVETAPDSSRQKATDIKSTKAPEPQIPFSSEGAEKVTINSIEYWQKTVFVPYLPDLVNSGEYKTIIYTLDGQEVGYIEYQICRDPNSKKKKGSRKKGSQYGHIGYLLVHEPFRKKLGIGKHLFKQAIYFFQKSNLLTIKWLACPHHLSPEDEQLSPTDRLCRLIAFYESLGAKIEGEKTDTSACMIYVVVPMAFPRCRYPLFF
jgi:ribosomal protein S18 acetylase RimI-like enzyme